MKLLLPFFGSLAAFLIGIEPAPSAESSEPPPAELLSSSTITPISGGIPRERLPENWSDGDVFGLRAFAEPLVAESRVASEEEHAAFSRAINAFLLWIPRLRVWKASCATWPGSRWAAAA